MTPLSRNEKELIFDYCLGLAQTEQAIPITTLLVHSAQAADFCARIQAALEPLGSLYPELCPPELVERTVRLLCAAARGVRAAARMNTADSSFHEVEDPRQFSDEFEAYDVDETAAIELSPEGTD